MRFQEITLDDIEVFQPFLSEFKARTCDFTVGGLFMWRKIFAMQYAMEDNVMYSRLHSANGDVYYNLPIGGSITDAISRILEYERPRKTQTVRFCTVPEEYVCLFSHMRAAVTSEEQFSDYLYRAEDLALLPGRKYSAQRNRIHQFERENSEWSFTPLQKEDLPEVIEYVNGEFCASHNDTSVFGAEEQKMTIEVLENPEKYNNLFGAILRAENRIVGFSIGEIKGDTLYVHIEKASRSSKGAYQQLTKQFVKKFSTNGVMYVNREEDMGDEGLRSAKLAYHPAALLKKYTVEVDLT